MWDNPILQVALDYEYLNDAVNMARLIHQELNDVNYYCEAGTPLIKNEGLRTVIPALRSIVGYEARILADLKTMDTGAFEVELAYKAGVDIVGIAGASEEETMEAAFSKARELGMPVMVDSIGVRNLKSRLKWIIEKIKNYNEEDGFAILEYHIPIDKQAKTMDFTQVKKISKRSGIPLAVAGGLDELIIPEVLGYGAKVLVIGRAITKPVNRTSKEAIRKIKAVVYKT